jgi:hemoglobin
MKAATGNVYTLAALRIRHQLRGSRPYLLATSSKHELSALGLSQSLALAGRTVKPESYPSREVCRAMTQDSALLAKLDTEATEAHASSPFVAVGGAAAVSAVVDEFYTRLLADPATAGFFTPLVQAEGLARLKRHQVLLLTKVLGGPDWYDGRDLDAAHADLTITEDAYQRVSLYLLTVLHDFKVPMDVLQVADTTLRSVRPTVVTEPNGAAES